MRSVMGKRIPAIPKSQVETISKNLQFTSAAFHLPRACSQHLPSEANSGTADSAQSDDAQGENNNLNLNTEIQFFDNSSLRLPHP
jgi:hypothetical protein